MLRSTLSRFKPMLSNALPLSSSNPDDFFIELADPHRTYSPGDVVQGNVVVVLTKPYRVTSVSCSLQGSIVIRPSLTKTTSVKHVLCDESVVLWGEPVRRPAEDAKHRSWRSSLSSPRRQSSGQSSGIESPSSPNASLNTLSPLPTTSSASSTDDPVLPRGEHVFAFEFTLPEKGLFNSLDFERGAISYVLTATCAKPGSSSNMLVAKRALSVICPIDVYALPRPRTSSVTVDVRKKRKDRGSITASISLPQKGYLRGELVPISISVQHIKNVKHLSGIIVTLSRISIVSAEGSEAQSFRKDLAQTISPLYTDPKTFASSVTANVRIPPDTFPTTKGHPDISFQYSIEVVMDLAGRWTDLSKSADGRSSVSSTVSGFVDTDKLKRGRGVVCLWTELVIGTHRSSQPAKLDGQWPGEGSSNEGSEPPNNDSTGSLRVSIPPRTRGSPQSTSSSISTYQVHRYDDEPPPIDPTDPGSSDVAPVAEKEALRHREEALLPSAPPGHVAPEYGQYEEGPSAPSYDREPSPPTTSLAEDKIERERLRLEQLATEPEDYVPSYSTGSDLPVAAPSVPPLVSSDAPSAPPVLLSDPAESTGESSSLLRDGPSAPPDPTD